jgi:hypothetical protein
MTEFTTHYWRVDEVLNDTSEITGPTWSVTTSLSDRLIAHWKFENNLDDEVDELAPAGGDWPGTMNDPNYDGGIDGQAIRMYRGDSRYITIPGSEDFFNFYSTGLTVNMWYKPDDYAIYSNFGWQGLISKRGGQNANGWMIFDMSNTYSGGGQIRLDAGATQLPERQGRLDDGNWHMLTLTYYETTQTATAYVDGEPYGTANIVASAGSAVPVIIGGTPWEYSGLVDEIKIWSKALTPLEIAVEYTTLMPGETVCPYPNDPSLQYDVDGNCKVDLADFAAIIAENWQNCNIVPTCLP